MSRLTQILRGKKIKPLTDIEAAVKYAIDNAGSGGGGGSSITVDAELSESSTNPVQNKVIAAALANIDTNKYETVLELENVQMSVSPSFEDFWFVDSLSLDGKGITKNTTLYINDTLYPLKPIKDIDDWDPNDLIFGYNIRMGRKIIEIDDATKPAYGIVISEDSENVFFANEDLSGTTVTIMKRIPAAMNEVLFDIPITATSDGIGGYTASTTADIQDILDAVNDGKLLRFNFVIDGYSTISTTTYNIAINNGQLDVLNVVFAFVIQNTPVLVAVDISTSGGATVVDVQVIPL